MLTVYLLDESGCLTRSTEVDPMGAIPSSAVLTPPPSIPGGHFARWSGRQWEVVDKRPQVVPEPPSVPESVSRRRGLQALFLMYGLKESDITAAIAAHPTLTADQKYLADVEFKTSQVFERNRPLVVMMGAALGIDLDAVFIYAAGIP